MARKLYEVVIDPKGERSYFIPQGPATTYDRCCEHCRGAIEPTGKALEVKWNGGNEPGDFVCTIGGMCAKRHVAEELSHAFNELTLHEVTILNRLNPTDKKRRNYYVGEDIVEIRSPLRVELDAHRCTIEDNDRAFVPCPVCGRVVGNLEGIELLPTESYVRNVRPPNYKRRVPREHGKGVFLFMDELKGSDFFSLGGSFHMFCTEQARDFILDRGFSNVDFREVGLLLSRGEPVPINRKDLSHRDGVYAAEPLYKESFVPRTVLGQQNVTSEIEKLKRHSFKIPRLSPDTPDGCPASMSEICDYLDVEMASSSTYELDWCRTANVEGVCFWVWQVDDDGHAYVYVRQRERDRGFTIGMNPGSGLTLEQFLVYEYLRGS